MNEVFPERRRSKRYLTLKNAAIAAVAIGAAVAAFSTWHQLRPARSGPSPSLFEDRTPSSDPRSAHHEPVTVVEEGPMLNQPGPDSILVDARPAAPQAKAPAIASSTPPPPENIEHRESPIGKGQQISITGGSEGVRLIVKTPAPTETSETAASVPPPQSQR